MSPRRSSRARQIQPLHNNPSQSGSSSSASSLRNNRTVRTHSRQDSNMKSATPQSSSDEPDRNHPHESDTRQTRQQKREQGNLDGLTEQVDLPEDVEDEEVDDNEVTRCICGQLEYPGPPEHVAGRPCINHRQLDSPSKNDADAPPHPLLFETGSLFIQCETCHVWQHGGCVGIMDEAMSPEHYYCEECKEPLHKIYVEPSGRKYSKYTRAYQDWECTRPSVTSKKSIYYETQSAHHPPPPTADRTTPSAISNAKRRSTMNSRAAADEDEAFLKAIEESKSEGRSLNTSAIARRTKRGREDSSEETMQELKRRKTGSESGSPGVFPLDSAGVGSETEGQQTALRHRGGNTLRKGRGGSVQSLREMSTRERDRERERDRGENGGRRKPRSERRGEEESENADENARTLDNLRDLQATGKPPSAQANSKQSSNTPNPAGSSISRRGVKSGLRRGRGGRNQYTKERETGTESKHDSPMASHSRDSEDVGVSDGLGHNMIVNGSKPSKPRYMNPNRTSMNDLRKRVAGILEYISRTQVEMAGDKTPPTHHMNGNKTKDTAGSTSLDKLKEARSRTRSSDNLNSKSSTQWDEVDEKKTGKTKQDFVESSGIEESSFKDLSSLQMMDVLTRELVLWQREHGKWGER